MKMPHAIDTRAAKDRIGFPEKKIISWPVTRRRHARAIYVNRMFLLNAAIT
jgi:hypothetical protein